MEKRRLGRTELEVPALCLGTMMYGDQISGDDAVLQMDACFDRGINFLDTAEMYTVPPKPETQGESERIVGRWLAARKNRDKIILATKVAGRSPAAYMRPEGGETRLTPDQIRFAIERSLKNLQTDYVDLYQLHWPDRPVQLFGAARAGYVYSGEKGVPIEETLGALGDLVKEGKVRHVGLSNETPYGVMRFLAAAKELDLPRVVSIQNAYNFLNRTFETGLAEIAMEEQVGLLAYSPIAQGVLTGKYLDGKNPAGSRKALFDRVQRYETPGADEAVRGYVALAEKFGVDPAAFAMAFVTSRPFVTSNIFGARTLDQLETIFASLNVEWTQDMENAVNELHGRKQNPCP
ncbi:aldo/keto reductase [Hyphococcus luteus]|uniref:Aldo/keto reductase n=1 Tax=Hyphococcus luteus TaxID=2058213 RepID=A0A2S7K1Z0_9PROT|nr:aldo/keto reductase [Marinicaulis flavus]PQA86524.1 aldo/keto reductase [Marinicaulis flavus]